MRRHSSTLAASPARTRCSWCAARQGPASRRACVSRAAHLRAACQAGGRHVFLAGGFRAAEALTAIAEQRVTALIAVPAMLVDLVAAASHCGPCPSVRRVLLGGGYARVRCAVQLPTSSHGGDAPRAAPLPVRATQSAPARPATGSGSCVPVCDVHHRVRDDRSGVVHHVCPSAGPARRRSSAERCGCGASAGDRGRGSLIWGARPRVRNAPDHLMRARNVVRARAHVRSCSWAQRHQGWRCWWQGAAPPANGSGCPLRQLQVRRATSSSAARSFSAGTTAPWPARLRMRHANAAHSLRVLS